MESWPPCKFSVLYAVDKIFSLLSLKLLGTDHEHVRAQTLWILILSQIKHDLQRSGN